MRSHSAEWVASALGRRQRYQRRTTEDYLALDIAVLRRRDLLQPGRSGTIAWSRGGERIGAATITTGIRSLRLTYNVGAAEGSAEAVDESIELRSSEMSLGGSRQCFTCPGCHRQCRVLYGGPRFRCRLCHGLQYECNSKAGPSAQRRAHKIRRRLGGSDCLMDELPPKPRGMHWGTFRRLEALEAAADNQWMAAVVARLGRSNGPPTRRRDKPKSGRRPDERHPTRPVRPAPTMSGAWKG